jgi:hypothetical protein
MARTTEEVSSQSSQVHESRQFFSITTWEDIQQPGAYVEMGSGDLYRFTPESLIPGCSPVIAKESRGASRLMKISADPLVLSQKARLLCAQANVKPNF